MSGTRLSHISGRTSIYYYKMSGGQVKVQCTLTFSKIIGGSE